MLQLPTASTCTHFVLLLFIERHTAMSHSDAESHTSSVDIVPSSRGASDAIKDLPPSDAERQDVAAAAASASRKAEHPSKKKKKKGPCFEGCGWWCRGCTRGLDWLPKKMGISKEEGERIYTLQFGGCGELFVPCIACNKDGRRPPGADMAGGSTLPDFWKGFEVNYAPSSDEYSEYVHELVRVRQDWHSDAATRSLPLFDKRADAVTRERVYERMVWQKRRHYEERARVR
jgi:hypothetical protein